MAYRPQYVMGQLPAAWEEEDFVYYFDGTNAPDLAKVLGPGESIFSIPLNLQRDSSFILHGIEISGNVSPLAIRFHDPWGNTLSEGLIEVDRGYGSIVNASGERLPVIVEPQIECPPGSLLLVDLTNLS